MRTVHLDCPSGIAGDMLLAALIDLGASLEYVREGLSALDLAEPWSLDVVRTQKLGISALRAEVRVGGALADADMDHDHGDDRHDDYSHDHDHGRDHSHARHHGHGHTHSHTHGAGHPHRPYREIRALLEAAPLPERVKQRAGAVFWELAKAEGAVHGIDPEDVHFHEVGSTDAIIDIVGCALALESLDVDELTASALHVGRGFVRSAHGRLPVPAPATLKLLEGLPAYQTDVTGELVTPTGAALVRALCRDVGPMKLRRIERVGCGAGRRDLPIPNIVRAILATNSNAASEDPACGWLRDDVIEIEANIDDMAPELYAYVMERLFAAGALDVWVAPVTMKKSRPGHILHVLGKPGDEARLVEVLFAETTTLGMRVRPARRWMLERSWVSVTIQGEPVRVKLGLAQGRIVNVAPEYDDCAKAASRLGLPLRAIYQKALELAREETVR